MCCLFRQCSVEKTKIDSSLDAGGSLVKGDHILIYSELVIEF